VPVVHSRYRPAWWLRNAHAQTLWPSLFRQKPKIEISRERVELKDGDFIDLIWSGEKSAPIVLFLHGLEGNIHSHYAAGIMQQLNQAGFRACLMHFRGCSEEPNRLPIAYHSGKTDDPAEISEHIKKHHGRQLFGVVGVSLGGNVALKWLGELGEQCELQRAAVMSVPFILNDAALRLRKGASRFYERHLIGNLQESYQTKFKQIESPVTVNVKNLRTFRQFDNEVTAPLHGYKDVDDYYTTCSSRPYISKIKIPTLILHAKDDPFMYPSTSPEENELSDHVYLELTAHGGHMGFISGKFPGKATYWAEKRLAEWMSGEIQA